MKPDFDCERKTVIPGLSSYPKKRFAINFDDQAKVVGSEEKIDYFRKEHGVRIDVRNEGGSQMILTICGLRWDIDIDQVAVVVSHFAPSLKQL